MAPQLKFAALTALALGAATTTFAQANLFSTTGNGTGFVGSATHAGREYGDEIVNPSAGYIFNSAAISYYASAAGGTMTFSIYDLTGPTIDGVASPGTLLFQSTGTSILAGNNEATITYGAGFALPARYAYTVSFNGTPIGSDSGLLVGGTTDPSSIGASGADFWLRTGPGANDWALNQVTGSYGNFKVSITGVPEPTTVALGVVGAAVLAGAALRRNRR